MKKQLKKMVLAKETVRDLDGAGLEQARGGDTPNPYYSAQGGCVVSQTCTTQQTQNYTI